MEKLTNIEINEIDDLLKIDLYKTPNLKNLSIRDINLETIDLSKLINLTYLYICNIDIKSLDISNLPNLSVIDISFSKINFLNITNLQNLVRHDICYNGINSLNISNLPKITQLCLAKNEILFLDIDLINLKELNISQNELTTLNTCKLKKLTWLVVNRNNLTELDTSNLTNLEWLDVSCNQLNFIDLTKLTKLKNVDISDNPFLEQKVLSRKRMHLLRFCEEGAWNGLAEILLKRPLIDGLCERFREENTDKDICPKCKKKVDINLLLNARKYYIGLGNNNFYNDITYYTCC